MKQIVAALFCGALFGAGLVVSQLSNPDKVLAFLDVLGDWDASLVVLMGVAVLTTAIGYRLVLKRPRPVLAISFQLPGTTLMNMPLVGGATLFGIGWGIAGYCPGPALTGLVMGVPEPWWFTVAMVAGFWVQRQLTAD